MRPVTAIMVSALLVGGCSTRPREFRPGLAQPATDLALFDRALIRCQVLVRRGVKGNFGDIALQGAAGTGAAFAAGAAVASAIPATGSSLINSGAVVAGTSTLVLVGPLVGFGVSRIIRSGRERKYKETLGKCMGESGFVVKDWTKQKKLSKAQVKAVLDEMKAPAPAPTSPAPPATAPAENPR